MTFETDAERRDVADFANEIFAEIFGESPNFSPDGWDINGGTAAIAETMALATYAFFDSSGSRAAYQDRMNGLADKILAEVPRKISRLSSGAVAEADALRRAAQTTADNMRRMGSLVAQGLSNVAISQSAQIARVGQFLASVAQVAGAALVIGQMVSKTYDAAIGEATTHNVLSTAVGSIVGTAFGVVAFKLGVVLLGSAIFPGVVAGAGAIAAAYVFGKIGENIYNEHGIGITDFLNDVGHWLGATTYDVLPESVNRLFFQALQFVFRRDPLVLDLDGDGLELLAASGNVLFDHNADGIKTGTGWAKSDDGLLVRDLNGNGSIDSGRELFGVDTVKSNGQLATQGFDALADLDSNGDGQITSADAAWSQLQVWRDLNQDGISQSNELSTLAELNITRIGLNGTSTGPQAGQTINNNRVALSTTFTQGGVTRTVGAIDLEANAFFSEIPPEVVDEAGSPVTITETAAALPQMSGSGMVRNLRAAMSLTGTQADELEAAVNGFAAATTRDAQRALLDNLITEWAQTSSYWSSLESTLGGTVTVNPPAGMTANEYRNMIAVLEAFNGSRFYNPVGGAMPAGEMVSSVGGVAHYTITPPADQATLLKQAYAALKESVYAALVVQTRLKPYLDAIELVVDESGLSFSTAGVDALMHAGVAADPVNGLHDLLELRRYLSDSLRSVGWSPEEKLVDVLSTLTITPAISALLAQERIVWAGAEATTISVADAPQTGYLLLGNALNNNMTGSTKADSLYGGTGNDALTGAEGADTYYLSKGDGADRIVDFDFDTAVIDAVEFLDVKSTDLVTLERKMGSVDLVLKYGTGDQLTVVNYFLANDARYKIEQFRFSDGVVWTEADVRARFVTVGTAGDDTIAGLSDIGDRIHGGDGADQITGNVKNDSLYGGAGNDVLTGDVGNDLLDGGTGNDMLTGGAGADVYYFSKGDGADRIFDADFDTTAIDAVEFRDVKSTDPLVLERHVDSFDLVLKYGTGDQLTVLNYFLANDARFKIEQFRFSDGVVWTEADVRARFMTVGTAGNDTIKGMSDIGDRIHGGDGADQITGNVKNDSLYGGTGNDTIYGGVGNDFLDGGVGNDYLSGEAGVDTYRFSVGSGVDRIYDYDVDASNTDVVEFLDVKSTDLVAMERRLGTVDLVIKYGTGDELTIVNYFHLTNPGFKIEQFKFSDGVVWNEADVRARFVTAGTSGNDTIEGLATAADRIHGGDGADSITGGDKADSLYGGAGNDIIFGGIGNDFLDGGVGNDYLSGEAGVDTYRFSVGSGVDRIYDYDVDASNTDVVEFLDVKSTDLVALERRLGTVDLVIKYGTGDELTVVNYFHLTNPGFKIEQFKFSDGVVWTEADVRARFVTAGTSGNDTIAGLATAADRIHGGDGADSITGGSKADSLYGGAGNDIIYGVEGNDLLDGGLGNDYLSGGVGADTYRFAVGSGVDRISDYDTDASNMDVVEFLDVKSTDLVALERKPESLDLVLRYGTGDELTVLKYFDSAYPGYKIEQFKFSDGVVWSEADVKARFTTTGTAAADTIVGLSDLSNRIHGLDGADSLTGGTKADSLYGGEGNDLLTGGAGNDVLEGGVGNDILVGGAGNDIYRLGRGDGADAIHDTDSTTGNTDLLQFLAGVSTDQIWLRRVANNLEVSIIGTGDSATINNWYAGNQYKVEQFKTADNKTLLSGQVDALVSAMAAFSPPPPGQTTLTPAQQTALSPMIAANWT